MAKLQIKDKFRVVDGNYLASVVDKVFTALERKEDFLISLAIVGSSEMKSLNNKHRRQNKVTDVLSFSFRERQDKFVLPKEDDNTLGEVVICYPQAKMQAKEKNISVNREIETLLVHGLLHLLGFDHIKNDDRQKMESLEKKILK